MSYTLNIFIWTNVCEWKQKWSSTFCTAVGGQAEENQDANNYYANHLWHHESRTQELSNPPKCQSNVRSPPSVWISTGCQKASG